MTVNMRKYSDRSFIVYGEDTKDMVEKLKELKGSYNRFLKDPINPEQKIKGWIFSKSRKTSVIDHFIMNDIDYKEIGKW